MLLIVGVLIIAYSFVMGRTVFGRHVYAIGGNLHAAILSGVDTRRVNFWIFGNMGALAGIAAVVTTSRAGAAVAAAGQNFELDAIAACFIGGTAVTGGIGRVSGAIVGALIMGVLNIGLSIMSVDPAWQQAIKGLVLLLAVAFDLLNKRRGMRCSGGRRLAAVISPTRALWIGTYPEAGAGTPAGRGEGIWRVEVGSSFVDGGAAVAAPVLAAPALVVTTPAPSFLATHPGGRVLYAVGEQAAGTVTSFAAGPDGQLGALAVVSSGGADPCHLLLAPDARTLYVTNYSSGSVGVLPLDVDGAFARATIAAGGPVQVLAHTGAGPDPDRQEGPHAHSSAFDPGGAHLLVADLGTDQLRRYRIQPDGRLTPDGIAATLPPGTGPRHLVAVPEGLLYVVGELDVTVRVLRWDGATATATLAQTLPATTARPVDSPVDSPVNLPAHLVLDGDRLLVSVRGADVISTFAVDPRTGLLAPAGEVASGGAWPRHFAVLDGVYVVAHQHSGTVDMRATRYAIPAPACIVPVAGDVGY